MQDREDIDKLFQQKFRDFEVEPSAHLFDRISNELDGAKTRKMIPVLWIAAASIIIAITAGLWFLQKIQAESEIRLSRVKSQKHGGKEIQSVIKVPSVQTLAARQESETRINTNADARAMQVKDHNGFSNLKPVVNNKGNVKGGKILTVENAGPDILALAPAKPEEELPEVKIQNGIHPDHEIKAEAPVLASVVSDDRTRPTDNPETSKPKIRSVGDIVNFVVSKIDRRQDKLLHFKDSEEGAEVTDINLGFVKYKSRNQ